MGINSLTERIVQVPDKIILSDGKETRSISFESCEPLEYLKLCVSMKFYSEKGVV